MTPTPLDRCIETSPRNACVPGGGAKKSDCILELSLRPVPPRTRAGVPKNRVTCYEGDPACDLDSDSTNHSCTFTVRLCINNSDPRLMTCVPSTIESIDVLSPKWNRTDAADLANLARLETQAGQGLPGFGVTVHRGDGTVLAGTPNSTADLCSDPLPMVVPLRLAPSGKWRDDKRAIKLRAATGSAVDTDRLTMVCRANTCGNGLIERPEECDDSNRVNGDGCSASCIDE